MAGEEAGGWCCGSATYCCVGAVHIRKEAIQYKRFQGFMVCSWISLFR